MVDDEFQRHLTDLERRLERRWRRRMAACFAMVLLIVIPATVGATHRFSDVPTSSTFHGAITRVADAGLTTGCAVGKFCPKDVVTREQMAAFLGRTGGRAAYDSNGFLFGLTSTKVEVAAVTIRASNVGGGTEFIKLDASGWIYTNGANETGCVPCKAQFIIEQEGASLPLNLRWVDATVANVSAVDDEATPVSITFVVPVQTGIDHTFRLMVSRTVGTGTINATGAMAATTFPFSGDGDATWP